MIAPNPKHWAWQPESPSSTAGSPATQASATATTDKQHARRAAASLLFDPGKPQPAGPQRRPSPWAVIVVWLLSVWMLIAVACHYSWMLHSLVHK